MLLAEQEIVEMHFKSKYKTPTSWCYCIILIWSQPFALTVFACKDSDSDRDASEDATATFAASAATSASDELDAISIVLSAAALVAAAAPSVESLITAGTAVAVSAVAEFL